MLKRVSSGSSSRRPRAISVSKSIPSDAAYGLDVKDPDRFVDELGRLFEV